MLRRPRVAPPLWRLSRPSRRRRAWRQSIFLSPPPPSRPGTRPPPRPPRGPPCPPRPSPWPPPRAPRRLPPSMMVPEARGRASDAPPPEERRSGSAQGSPPPWPGWCASRRRSGRARSSGVAPTSCPSTVMCALGRSVVIESVARRELERRHQRLDALPARVRDSVLSLGQVPGEELDGLRRMVERNLRLAEVVEDRELRADGVGGAELLKRCFVAAISRQLDAVRVVRARGIARLVRRRETRPVRARTEQTVRFAGRAPTQHSQHRPLRAKQDLTVLERSNRSEVPPATERRCVHDWPSTPANWRCWSGASSLSPLDRIRSIRSSR